jgi:sugar phosphate isomerase/epimerase
MPHLVRQFLCVALLATAGQLPAAAANPFFAMDTIAKGGPEVVVPLLQSLGYDGLGGAAGDGAMAAALEQAGLRFFNGYLTLQFNAEGPALDAKLRGQLDAMQGHRTALWLAIARINRAGQPLPAGAPEGNEIAARNLKEIADYAAPRGVRVSLYPHTGHWFEHFAAADAMTRRLQHEAVGVTFNLCHWLKVEGAERDPLPLLRAALPRLQFVTVNGADAGDTTTMTWARLIQPLGAGTYDVAGFVRRLQAAGYDGPVGFQGYGIKSPARDVLTQTINAWREMSSAPPAK